MRVAVVPGGAERPARMASPRGVPELRDGGGVTGDAFRRLGLLAGATVWAVGLVVVGLYVSWWAAAAGAVAGPLVAVMLTIEASPAAPGPRAPRRRDTERLPVVYGPQPGDPEAN